MRFTELVTRSLVFRLRSHIAVMLGAAVGTATLAGALVVGDSMRASLSEAAIGRLGRVDFAMTAPHFVREELADEVVASRHGKNQFDRHAPTILARGGISNASDGSRVAGINILGVDDRFWRLGQDPNPDKITTLSGRSVILNDPLARELGVAVGDTVLVRMGKPSAISKETLLGRRDDSTKTLRLSVRGIVPGRDLGAFGLSPRQALPKNAFVPLDLLQRLLDQPGRVNTILLAKADEESSDSSLEVGSILADSVADAVTLSDFGLRIRVDEQRGYFSLESDSLLVDPAVEDASLSIANDKHWRAAPIITYLANTIEKNGPLVREGHANGSASAARTIPYSTVTALNVSPDTIPKLTLRDGSPAPNLKAGELLLNKWAADDLNASVGDRIILSYYVTEALGELQTNRTSFTLRGVVRMDEVATDVGFVPEYEGITDTESLSEWNPPFPIDFDKVRDKDDVYWNDFRTAPKAFISLDEGRGLWAEQGERFGRATSIRIYPAEHASLETSKEQFRAELLARLDPAAFGIQFEPVRKKLAEASRGSTDFGGLFIGFSFFLIASAAMLVGLLFRLGVEKRASEIGLLMATGYSPSAIVKLLVFEGSAVTVGGTILGVPIAIGYAYLMLAGLRTAWSAAVNAPFLHLQIDLMTLAMGAAISVVVSIFSIAWAIRGLAKQAPRTLLAGVTNEPKISRAAARRAGLASLMLIVIASVVILLAVIEKLPSAIGFFLGGALLLIACLVGFRDWLRVTERNALSFDKRSSLWRLGASNTARNRGRSLLTAGLIASATFVIVALQAFRLETTGDVLDRNSGTGGFSLVAEAANALPYTLSSAKGRESLGIDRTRFDELGSIEVYPLRLRPGDESSCLNLYVPTKPRIIGATSALIDRGGFRFSKSMATSPAQRQNPWMLLSEELPDGAIPAIGDEAAVLWQLHSGLGKDFAITDERGQEVRLKFVALLSGSVLQDELIVAESNFVKLFPSVDGHGFFLLQTSGDKEKAVQQTLEQELESFAFDVTTSRHRLNEYHSVQNTYLATFQTLGGLGLILGTMGLAVVLFRNVWERRSELALFRALGFSDKALRRMVLAENIVLVVAGLLSGVLPALVSISPHILRRAETVPWISIGWIILGVLVIGVGAGTLALRPLLRAPLLHELRSE